MPYATLVLLVQVLCAAHCIRSGREQKWIWLILIFPGVGCLLYLFLEVLPDARASRSVSQAGSKVVRMVDPGREIRKAREQLEIADSLRNRRNLAAAYIQEGLFAEAVDILETCLSGLYADDPFLLMELSFALFFKGDLAGAGKSLERLAAVNPGFEKNERTLLTARVLEETGRLDEALEHYASILKVYPGEEARCRYAMLLNRTGREEEARKLFNEILVSARQFRRHKFYRKSQKPWIELAKKGLAGTL